MAHKTRSFLGQIPRAFMELFFFFFFVPRDWAVILSVKHEKWGTNELRSLMGRATKEQGRSPAGSNTETSVSHRTERTRTFGSHMVFEISSQFQTI